MTASPWADVDAALTRAGEAGAVTRFWLRDDDAVAVTPALARLDDLCAGVAMPVLLAVIPAHATPELAAWVAERARFIPCQHGFTHANHAVAGERACELGGGRPDEAVTAELRAGRERMQRLFGPPACAILVPPWNRIRPSLVPLLPDLGYAALSTFAEASRTRPLALPEIDCDLDIVDWRNGRRGRTAGELCAKLVRLIAEPHRHGRPIGLLTHHLAHDEAAWSFLAAFLERMGQHPAVRFERADRLDGMIQSRADPPRSSWA